MQHTLIRTSLRLTGLWLAAGSLCTLSSTARAGDAPRGITTSGDAVIYVVPDKAVIKLAIDTFAGDLAEVEKSNEAKGKQLVDAIEKMGIDSRQIGTDDVSISTIYRDYTGRKQSDIDGYRTVRQYSITVTDTKLVQKIIDTALVNGANTLSGVQYQDTQSRKHRDEARQMAAKAAREKAIALAATLDCQVGKPIAITENAIAMSSFFGNAYSNSSNHEAAPANDADDSLPPGQLAVRASVTVQFDFAEPKIEK